MSKRRRLSPNCEISHLGKPHPFARYVGKQNRITGLAISQELGRRKVFISPSVGCRGVVGCGCLSLPVALGWVSSCTTSYPELPNPLTVQC